LRTERERGRRPGWRRHAKLVNVINSVFMARWKKLGLVLVAACGLALVVIAIFGKFPRAASSGADANPWNSHAIQSTFAGARVREVDPTHAAVVFLYDLSNGTDRDYRLANGPNVVVMSRLKPGGSLSPDRQVRLDSDAFVPAGNRTRVALEMNDAFDWPTKRDSAAEREVRKFVADEVAGLDGFVLFDQKTRYQIEFPAASPEAQQTPATTSRN
jgi:hypothetical protein